MAYSESTIGGTYGGSFRVWVNSIRVYDGNQSENFEDWRCEGGINRVSTSGGRIYSNGASYTVQLGINGMATSGGFTYNYTGGTGGMNAWGTGTTRAYRNSAGVGFGFTSRTDVNLNNSPYLTSGWVQSSDGVQTKYRHASLTALSTDQDGIPFTDEGPAWVEFYNPSGTAVDAWLEMPDTTGRVFTSGSIGSRYNYDFSSSLPAAIQAASPNSNTYTIRIGIHDSMGGDSWDYRDRTGTIANDHGQANPTFTNFTYSDTNSTTAAITGNNQVLIQGKSTLQAVVTVANKATPNKSATMASYNYTIGGYSQSATYSSGSNVTQNIGVVSDVTGTQSLAVRAIDSRTNGTAVTKSLTILPYTSPYITPYLRVSYTNNYDTTDGITVTTDTSGTNIASISPLTLSGTDKNSVNSTTGVQFDISKGNNTSYTGTWVNVPVSRTSGSPNVTTTLSTLATSVLAKMNALTADNTVVWYIKFKIVDALETQYRELALDVGKPIFRIGTDGQLWYNEYPINNPGVLNAVTGTVLTPDCGVYGTFRVAALATALTINRPTNGYDGRRIVFVFKDNGTARALTWDSGFVPIGVSLPTQTTPGKWTYVGVIGNAYSTNWDVVAVNIQA